MASTQQMMCGAETGGSGALAEETSGAMDMLMSGAMQAMAPMSWTASTALVMFFMWWIMMVAMMLPSAAPMILLFAAVNRKQRNAGSPYVTTGIFAFGYLAVWGFFSLVAVAAQWGLERTELLKTSPEGRDSQIIGEITADYSAQVYVKTRVGGQRILPFLSDEQLPRIC